MKKTKNTILKVVNNFLILVGILAILIIMLAMIGNLTEQSTDYPESDTISQREIDSMERGYIDQCATIPEMEEPCKCMWDYLVDQKGYKGLLRMGLEMMEKDENKIPSIMYDALHHCMN